MPTYQYRCKQCGDEFEKVQSFSDDSTPKCPGCGTRSKKYISKVFGQVGISFKGSGFYKNDHGVKKPASTSSTNGTDSPKSTKSDGASSPSTSKTDSASKSESGSGSSKSDSVKSSKSD